MKRVGVWAAAAALALIALGLPVTLLQAPPFTHALAARFARTPETGLPESRVLEVAEMVRAYVVERDGKLPSTIDGREGFDAHAVSHLDDVARILAAARAVVLLLLAGVSLWGAGVVRARRRDEIPEALERAAVLALAVSLAGVLAGALGFDTFFTTFHRLLFAEGTWVFPPGSLLIQVFPEPFWVVSGLCWALVTVALAAAYVVAGRLLVRRGWAHRGGSTGSGA